MPQGCKGGKKAWKELAEHLSQANNWLRLVWKIVGLANVSFVRGYLLSEHW